MLLREYGIEALEGDIEARERPLVEGGVRTVQQFEG